MNSGGHGTHSQALAPHREQDAVDADDEQAGQVDGVSAAQRIASGKSPACTATASVSSTARVAAQNSAQAASAWRCSTGSRRPARPAAAKSAPFGVCNPAGHSSVAPVPQLRGQLAASLLDKQFDERAAVEIHDGH
jgi:hypothetical protein